MSYVFYSLSVRVMKGTVRRADVWNSGTRRACAEDADLLDGDVNTTVLKKHRLSSG
jgi:hypothetical protein